MDIIERLNDPEMYVDAIDDAIREIENLRAELKVTDQLLNERMRVMEAIPECESHGSNCVPHAIEWVEEAKKVMLAKVAG